PDGHTPLETSAADGALLRITISPDGATQIVADRVAGNEIVQAVAVNTITVVDAPLSAKLVPIHAVEGAPFTGTVAMFTDANPNGRVSDFTASILWGDGTAASAGVVVADGGGRFHVVGSHTYADAGSFAIRVVVRDADGSAASAAASAAPTQIGGLQAPPVAFSSDGVQSSSAADVNGDGKSDLIIEGPLPEAGLSHLFVLLGRGDGTFRDPIDLGSHNDPVVAIADVNGDGKPDIVTSVMVLLGNGDGTFRDGP